jgi:galactokinase
MIAEFRERYGGSEDIRVYRAPGRVNLIGEHTDYNQGMVLPMALDLAAYVATAASPDRNLRIYSEEKRETFECPVDEIAGRTRTGRWPDYAIGVAQQLSAAGFPVRPANLLIRSMVPEGAGLSSSAAIEVSVALALLNGREVAPLELVRFCLNAEREFVGMPCGIMDQYISVFGRDRSAIRIDCRSLEHHLVELPQSVTFVAVNTMVKHELAVSAYQERVRECAAAAGSLNRTSLRDVSMTELQSAAGLDDTLMRRARHVVSENRRVECFVEAAARSDSKIMGELMAASHRSLRDDYEVSCAELNFLVDTAVRIDGVYGSRMTGGGFGGCTVTLLRSDSTASFTNRIARAYQREYNVTPDVYPCHPGGGAGELKNLETNSGAR